MKNIIIGVIIGVIVGVGMYMAVPQRISGIYSNPGIVDLGTPGLASGSVSNVSGTVKLVLAANPTRAYAYCQHMSGLPTVYLGLSNTASISWGIGLKASESYEIIASKNLYRGAIYAKTTGGTARVSCIER